MTELSFGQWIRLRRRQSDMTQQELADCAGCSVVTIRKFEADERRPSKLLAELLAGCLQVPTADLERFVAFARTPEATAHPAAYTATPAVAPPEIPAALPKAPPLLNTLPAPLTSLLGRRQDIAFVSNVLLQPGTRLLTLTAPGGTGKTRLALAVADRLAREYATQFPDGVHFIDLSAVFDPALVLSVLAQSLGLKESGDTPIRRALEEFLRPRQMLLVLDNFEQVVAAGVELPALLKSAPGLRLLVTSRVVLHIYGEHEFPVLPLPLPADDRDLPGLLEYPAIALFVERSRAVRSGFALAEENAADVVAICRRLDGLPLAIELAAARSKLYSPAALLAQLPAALDLSARLQSPTERQSTLRRTIEWSFRLLGENEQRLFARLGLFAGEFSLEAAYVVAGEHATAPEAASSAVIPAEFVEQVLTLVDHSQLQPVEPADSGAGPRFRLLFTLRDFALERLAELGELPAGQQRYADYYLALAREAAAHLEGPGQASWLRRLEATHDNLRAVLAWSLEGGQRAAAGLELAVTLCNFWKMHGHLSEGRLWLDRALAAGREEAPHLRASAYLAAARLAQAQGNLLGVDEWLQAGLALYREMDDRAGREGMAAALNLLGATAWRQEQYAAAADYYEQALALRRTLDDAPKTAESATLPGIALPGIGPLLYNLGLVAQHQGQYERARDHYLQALELDTAAGDQWARSLTLNALGTTAREQGAYREARAFLEESLAIKRQLEDRSGMAMVLSNLGNVDVGQGRLDEAQAGYERSLALAEATGSRVTITMAHFGLAMVAVLRPAPADTAWRRLSAALVLCREQQMKRVTVWLLDVVAQFLAGQEQPEAAVQLLGHAERLRELYPLAPRSPTMQPFYERALALARSRLDEAGVRRAWEAGRTLSPEEAVELALERGAAAAVKETP